MDHETRRLLALTSQAFLRGLTAGLWLGHRRRRASKRRRTRWLVTTRENETMHIRVNGRDVVAKLSVQGDPDPELVTLDYRNPTSGRMDTVSVDMRRLLDDIEQMDRVAARQPASGPADSEPAPAAAGQEEGEGGAPAADSGAPTDADALASNRELERENPADTGADPERPA